MSTKPDALRLADALVYWHGLDSVECDAAIELRRLHTQRDALLEALKNIDKEFKEHGRQHWPEAVKARAAIAAAEGEAK